MWLHFEVAIFAEVIDIVRSNCSHFGWNPGLPSNSLNHQLWRSLISTKVVPNSPICLHKNFIQFSRQLCCVSNNKMHIKRSCEWVYERGSVIAALAEFCVLCMLSFLIFHVFTLSVFIQLLPQPCSMRAVPSHLYEHFFLQKHNNHTSKEKFTHISSWKHTCVKTVLPVQCTWICYEENGGQISVIRVMLWGKKGT